MKRFACAIVCVMLVLLLLPATVHAQEPAEEALQPTPWFTFYCENLPEGTAYVDLLIHLPETDPLYAPAGVPEYFSDDCGIAAYDEDDYRSYTLYYSGAKSIIAPDGEGAVVFFTDSTDDPQITTHAEEVFMRGPVRLAMLDEKGDILRVSGLLRLESREFMTYLMGTFYYDAASDTVEVLSGGAGLGLAIYVVISVFALIVTCFTEWLVAKLFRLTPKYGKLVVKTNVVSEVIMRCAHVLLYSVVFWRWSYGAVVLNFVVIAGEYAFYKAKMKDISGKKCFAYTVCANLVSIVGVLLVNNFFLG